MFSYSPDDILLPNTYLGDAVTVMCITYMWKRKASTVKIVGMMVELKIQR